MESMKQGTQKTPGLVTVRRALLSAYNKQGLVPFARRLEALGIEIMASGGTARELTDAGIKVRSLDSLTGFSQLFGGRVKTLTPQVHGGILQRRGHAGDRGEAEEYGILPIDLVAVDLYPYDSVATDRSKDTADRVELIDIGGPTMLRASAKNHVSVVSICDRSDYDRVAGCLESGGGVPLELSRELACKTFAKTAAYDALIASTLGGIEPGTGIERFVWAGEKTRGVRYGENPGQDGGLYTAPGSLWEGLQVHQGKELSFNNLLDLVRGALIMREFASETKAVTTVIKHGIPAGTAKNETLEEALKRAWDGDALSAFGGVIFFNRQATAGCATFLKDLFFEIVVAPSWSGAALAIMSKKKRRIVLTWDLLKGSWDIPLKDTRWALDGFLIQDPLPPGPPFSSWKNVTDAAPIDPGIRSDLEFAWTVCRHIRSNAIVLVK
ncbi:MAG: bifunctional phosphoribosylaminoimidazolecarboxamide formyltransferase/IMP cyclohydrolase, partial [Candidatus Eisenbacteria bacterium]|nr:bifunctional phosphoribosylaminoimidazolecarboxamide formyltransferase/IMP cyclohydrolase [Candidatus Eisenbacteria bacterium]